MSTNPAQRNGTASQGSLTLTASEAGPVTLRLRAEPEERRRIQWAEDVVDNEGMGKKSSKVCCIYHKPREAGESSSDESSSSSSDDSDSEPDNSRARPANRNPHDRPDRPCHDHDHDHAQDSPEASKSAKGKKKKARRPSPNAYERLPKRKDPKKD